MTNNEKILQLISNFSEKFEKLDNYRIKDSYCYFESENGWIEFDTSDFPFFEEYTKEIILETLKKENVYTSEGLDLEHFVDVEFESIREKLQSSQGLLFFHLTALAKEYSEIVNSINEEEGKIVVSPNIFKSILKSATDYYESSACW